MENSRALVQLKSVLRRVKLPPILDPSERLTLLAVIEKFPDQRDELLWYLVLCADHDHLVDDPVVGFVLSDSVALSVESISQVILSKSGSHSFLEDLFRHGPIRITLSFIDYISRHHWIGSPDSEICLECHKALPFAIMDKMNKVITHEAIVLSRPLKRTLDVIRTRTKDLLGSSASDLQPTARSAQFIYLSLKHLTHAIKTAKKMEPEIEDLSLYHIGSKYSMHSGDTQEDPLEDLIEVFAMILGQAIQQISVDFWIQMAEMPTDDCNDFNMQTVIGNCVYEVDALIKLHNIKVSSEMSNCLELLKVKPLSDDELIRSFTREKLMQLLKEDVSNDAVKRGKIFAELVAHPLTFIEEESLELVILNMDMDPTPELMKRLLSGIRDKSKSNPQFKSKCVEQFLRKFKELKITQQIARLEFVSEMDLELLHSSEIPELTVALNKLSKESDQMLCEKEIVSFALQNVEEVVTRLIPMAISSVGNISMYLDLIMNLQPLILKCEPALRKYRTLLTEALRDQHSDREWDNIALILRTASEAMLPKEMKHRMVFEEINDIVDVDDFGKAYSLVCVLKELLDEIPHIVPFLASLAQIMCRVSWTSASFQSSKADVYSACKDIHSILRPKFLESLSSGDKLWLQEFLKSRVHEPVLSLFWYLWEEDQYPSANKFWFHMRRSSLPGEERKIPLSLSLLPIIERIHSNEWPELCSILGSEFENVDEEVTEKKVFKLLADAVTLMAKCTGEGNVDCFENCIISLTKQFQSMSEGCAWLPYLLTPLNELKIEDVRDRCYLRILPALVVHVKASPEPHQELQHIHCDWQGKVALALESCGSAF